MRKYVKDNKVYTIEEIRKEHPNKSIPRDADCSSLGFEFLIETEPPVQEGFYARETAPVNNIQTWELVENVVVPEPVPFSITQRQARLIMLERGILDTVENTLKMEPEKYIEWSYASSIERTTPLVNEIADSLGLSAEVIDEMFISASKL